MGRDEGEDVKRRRGRVGGTGVDWGEGRVGLGASNVFEMPARDV